MGALYGVWHILGKICYSNNGQDAGVWDFIVTLFENPLHFFFELYCFILFLAVLLLSVYHTIISMQNLTTNEHVKNYYGDRNPFDFGPKLNCIQIYWRPERVMADGGDAFTISFEKLGDVDSDYSYDDA